MNKDRAIIYCRVSSAEQVGSLSLPTQERLCREYIEKQGWEAVRVFVEPGESAKSADRPVFQEALGFCQQKKNAISYMVVHALSRFCRNTEDHVFVAAMLRKCGVKLRSATEPIDDSYIGKFMETVLAGFAELDKIEGDLGVLRIDADANQSDRLDAEAVLQFAQQMVSNAVQFWQAAPLEQKQRFVQVLCPAGITVSGEGIVGTPAIAPVFRLLQMDATPKSSMESLIVSTWNQIINWLRQVDQFRKNVTSLPGAA
jgi:hypothetical protein